MATVDSDKVVCGGIHAMIVAVLVFVCLYLNKLINNIIGNVLPSPQKKKEIEM
jgi:hypothetical protein